MVADSGGGRLYHFHSALLGLRSRFGGKGPTQVLAPFGRGTRALSPHKRHRSLSPTAAMMWRMISRGTEPGLAHGLLTAWPGWEYISHRLWPAQDIPSAPYRLLQIRLGFYHGEPLTLPDGTMITNETVVCELHCNNRNLLELAKGGRTNPFAATREDLRSLATWMQRDEAGLRVHALYGVTMLVTAALRLGFTVRAQRINVRRRFERVFMSGLLLLYTAEGLQRLLRGTTSQGYPQEIWISRRELIGRYGNRLGRLLKPHNRPTTTAS